MWRKLISDVRFCKLMNAMVARTTFGNVNKMQNAPYFKNPYHIYTPAVVRNFIFQLMVLKMRPKPCLQCVRHCAADFQPRN